MCADSRMPKFDHHFLPLTPPTEKIDLPNVRTLEEATYETKTGHMLRVRLLGRPHTIDAICVSIPAEDN
jgi:hypothetical protein